VKYSIEQTVRRLRELHAPELLVRLATGTPAPGSLRYELQEPYAFYVAATEDLLPFYDQLVPLWETNGDSITAFVDVESPFVIRYYYEDPPELYEVVGHTMMEAIEQKLAWLLKETGDEPAAVLAAARACNHPSPDEFVQRLQALQ